MIIADATCGRISVVVPVFNAGRYIDGCLNSIVSQLDFIHEVVLVDDRSTDNHTMSVLRSYVDHPSFTVLFNQANIGVCESQNRGIAEATGDYVAFIDCDDMLLPGALQAVLAAIDEGHYDYIFTNRVHIDEKNQIVGAFRAEAKIQDQNDMHDNLLDSMFASHFKVVKRVSLMRAGGFVQGTEGIQDWDVALKISEFGRFCFIPDFLYAHRLHGNQTTAKHQAALFVKTNKVRRQALERQSLVYRGEIKAITLAQIRDVIRHLRFSRLHHGVMFTKQIRIGVALAWVDGRLCIYPLDPFLDMTGLDRLEWIIIYGLKWHELGALRKVCAPSVPPIILAVDERSQDSVAMARWFSSYFYGMAYMSEAAELAVSGYIEDRIINL